MYKKLLAGLTASALSFSCFAQHSQLEIQIDFDLDGDKPCEIVSPLIFDLGTVTTTGMYFEDVDVVIQCEDVEQGFNLFFDESADTTGSDGNIYKDDYIEIFAGSLTERSSGDLVRFNGLYNERRDGCTWGGLNTQHTRTINVGGTVLYPIGGVITTSGSTNKNSCVFRTQESPTGEYTIAIRAIAMVSSMPSSDDVDSIPRQFILPLTLQANIDNED